MRVLLEEGTHGINSTTVSFGFTKNSHFFSAPAIAKHGLAVRGPSAEKLSIRGEPHTVNKVTVLLERKRETRENRMILISRK